MTKDEVNKEYFEWIYDLVCWDQRKSFRMLLDALDSVEFTYDIEMDENRAQDGIDLRYRFGDAANYPDSIIRKYLDDHHCTVLEMMVALAVRYEEHIMWDADLGDRTNVWFWEMLNNLGIAHMSDDHFNMHRLDAVIERLLARKYAPDGTGGLFRIPGCLVDLRDVEIWYQGIWYLDTII